MSYTSTSLQQIKVRNHNGHTRAFLRGIQENLWDLLNLKGILSIDELRIEARIDGSPVIIFEADSIGTSDELQSDGPIPAQLGQLERAQDLDLKIRYTIDVNYFNRYGLRSCSDLLKDPTGLDGSVEVRIRELNDSQPALFGFFQQEGQLIHGLVRPESLTIDFMKGRDYWKDINLFCQAELAQPLDASQEQAIKDKLRDLRENTIWSRSDSEVTCDGFNEASSSMRIYFFHVRLEEFHRVLRSIGMDGFNCHIVFENTRDPWQLVMISNSDSQDPNYLSLERYQYRHDLMHQGTTFLDNLEEGIQKVFGNRLESNGPQSHPNTGNRSLEENSPVGSHWSSLSIPVQKQLTEQTTLTHKRYPGHPQMDFDAAFEDLTLADVDLGSEEIVPLPQDLFQILNRTSSWSAFIMYLCKGYLPDDLVDQVRTLGRQMDQVFGKEAVDVTYIPGLHFSLMVSDPPEISLSGVIRLFFLLDEMDRLIRPQVEPENSLIKFNAPDPLIRVIRFIQDPDDDNALCFEYEEEEVGQSLKTKFSRTELMDFAPLIHGLIVDRLCLHVFEPDPEDHFFPVDIPNISHPSLPEALLVENSPLALSITLPTGTHLSQRKWDLLLGWFRKLIRQYHEDRRPLWFLAAVIDPARTQKTIYRLNESNRIIEETEALDPWLAGSAGDLMFPETPLTPEESYALSWDPQFVVRDKSAANTLISSATPLAGPPRLSDDDAMLEADSLHELIQTFYTIAESLEAQLNYEIEIRNQFATDLKGLVFYLVSQGGVPVEEGALWANKILEDPPKASFDHQLRMFEQQSPGVLPVPVSFEILAILEENALSGNFAKAAALLCHTHNRIGQLLLSRVSGDNTKGSRKLAAYYESIKEYLTEQGMPLTIEV